MERNHGSHIENACIDRKGSLKFPSKETLQVRHLSLYFDWWINKKYIFLSIHLCMKLQCKRDRNILSIVYVMLMVLCYRELLVVQHAARYGPIASAAWSSVRCDILRRCLVDDHGVLYWWRVSFHFRPTCCFRPLLQSVGELASRSFLHKLNN